MKERLNTSIHAVTLIMVAAGLAWVVWSKDTSMHQMLTYLILLLIGAEILSLYLIKNIYPESHTTFKVGIIVALVILLGVKTMMPSMFTPLTLMVLASNYMYNFYTDTKRRKGTLKKNRQIKAKPRLR
jgi:hypothetical protein